MDRKGSILMISLWVLAILVVFAVGLGHRAAINLRLARYQRDRLKADCLAKAGIQRAIAELDKDKKDTALDSLNEPWSSGKDAANQYFLKDVELKKDSGEKFTIGNYDKEDNSFCMIDEERKINLNNKEVKSTEILIALLVKKAELLESEARKIVPYIQLWRGDNITISGLSDDDLIKFKRQAFSNVEELKFILEYYYKSNLIDQEDYRVKAQELYHKIKDSLTVYGGKEVNINTVPEDVLRIITTAAAPDTPANETCVEALINDLIAKRKENPFTTLDGIIPNVPVECQGYFNNLKPFIKVTSDYFQIDSSGKVGKTVKKITATYCRGQDNSGIKSWHEN